MTTDVTLITVSMFLPQELFWMNVVVQFYPWFKFYFLLFLGMLMYDNKLKTKKIKFKPRIKLNDNMNNETIIRFSL